LIGSAMAWGGNPETDGFYLNVTRSEKFGTAVRGNQSIPYSITSAGIADGWKLETRSQPS
jgi:hypothetical protein